MMRGRPGGNYLYPIIVGCRDKKEINTGLFTKWAYKITTGSVTASKEQLLVPQTAAATAVVGNFSFVTCL